MGPLSGSAVQATLEGPFCEEDPGRLEKRQIPRPVPEAPPVSAAKLRHYSGGAVVYHYYDHRTQQYRQQTLTQEEMIGLYISHIPEKNFKMVRYYGFLSNRKRGGAAAEGVRSPGDGGAENTGTARLRRADEGIPAHRPVQMHPVR